MDMDLDGVHNRPHTPTFRSLFSILHLTTALRRSLVIYIYLLAIGSIDIRRTTETVVQMEALWKEVKLFNSFM